MSQASKADAVEVEAMKHAASTNSAKNLELNDGMVVDGTNTGVLNQPLTPAEVESKVDGED